MRKVLVLTVLRVPAVLKVVVRTVLKVLKVPTVLNVLVLTALRVLNVLVLTVRVPTVRTVLPAQG
jgi:hypothetical protein